MGSRGAPTSRRGSKTGGGASISGRRATCALETVAVCMSSAVLFLFL